MKHKALVLFVVLAVFAGCKKNGEPQTISHGTLTGYDMATCAFCGGIKITITDDTTKMPPPFYRINGTLSQMGIAETTAFPINVTLNWKKDTSALKAGNYVIVSNVTIQR